MSSLRCGDDVRITREDIVMARKKSRSRNRSEGNILTRLNNFISQGALSSSIDMVSMESFHTVSHSQN